MRIVVLDGYTLNPGDLSWDGLRACGTCEIHPRTPAELVVERSREADIVITNKIELGREEIGQLPRLKYIGVTATGYNIVDLAAARGRGIPVTNVPTYGTRSVAEMVFAHLFNLTLHVGQHAQGVQEGRWTRSADFCYWDFPLTELSGKTLGIVGFGRIGRAVARAAAAFEMRVLVYDATTVAPEQGIEPVDLETLFRTSDVVSLHCPLTPQTERLVNSERLAWMKPTALLINTSRGALVDDQALADALNAGRIAGAGLDVLAVEPPPADQPLFAAKNCYITPHIAWATQAARQRLLDAAVANIRAFLDGKPRNVVN